MPLYLRTNVAWTPNSLKAETFTLDDDDFVLDPDQRQDLLPQPYRMIDKLLKNLVDDVWEHVSQRESKRIADASRFRPPQYECAIHVESESSSSVSSMASTCDGEFVILGLVNGLVVVHADSQKITDVWIDDNLHITSLHIVQLAEGKHVISTIDDMGQARLYGLAGSQLYLLQALFEGGGEQKVIAGLCEASSQADYLSVYVQRPSTQTSWLEIYKLPKDGWIRDLDGLVAKATTKNSTHPQEHSLDTQLTSENQVTSDTKTTVHSQVTEDQVTSRSNDSNEDQRTQSSSSQRSDRTSHKFTPATIHFKVLSPPQEVIGMGSIQQAMKFMDVNCDVIGIGQHHLITTSHLEQRHAVFDQQHDDLNKYIPPTSNTIPLLPTCHFLRPGKIISQGLENIKTADEVNSIAVWWSQGTQLLIYSLLKQSKELERKPDVVFPLSAHITSSCVSSDGSKLALALYNNNIVILDIYMGCVKRVKHMNEEGFVTSVTFIDPAICPQDDTEYPPYSMTSSYFVMVTMDTGDVYLVNCTDTLSPSQQVTLGVLKEDEVPVICKPVPGLPNLLLTSRRNGSVYIHDLHGNQLCQVTLPSQYQLASPWQPLMCVGANGRMLYLKGEMRPSTPTEDDTQGRQVAPPSSGLFVFQLRSFPTLDRYREQQRQPVPYTIHNTVNDRVNALLSERLSQQALRVSRMQTRWSSLKNEIINIQKSQITTN